MLLKIGVQTHGNVIKLREHVSMFELKYLETPLPKLDLNLCIWTLWHGLMIEVQTWKMFLIAWQYSHGSLVVIVISVWDHWYSLFKIWYSHFLLKPVFVLTFKQYPLDGAAIESCSWYNGRSLFFYFFMPWYVQKFCNFSIFKKSKSKVL